MSYTDRIKQLIESVVKANDNQEITGQKLQNVLIAMLDATEETYKLIDSLEVGGVALLQTLGDSETMGISQKVLTEYITNIQEQISQEISNREQAISALKTELKSYTDAEQERAEAAEQTLQNNINAEQSRAEIVEQNLQGQINEIVGGDATVSLTANPPTIFVGQQYNIALNATTNKSASSIIIKKAGTQIASGSGSSLQKTDIVTADATGSISYSAEFIISGITRTASRNVTAVYPIYFGAGLEQTDVLGVAACKVTARTTPNGTYNVTVADSPKYIWFFVPSDMPQITSAKMNGFDFPLEAQPDATEGGVTYKVYRTPNTQETGTYSIIINPT